MTVCKHCGTEIEEGLEYCPNCGQSIDKNFGDFFSPDEGLEEEAYNIFDAPEEFDMDSLLFKEFAKDMTVSEPLEELPAEEEEIIPALVAPSKEDSRQAEPEPDAEEKPDDITELLGLFEEQPVVEELQVPEEQAESPSVVESETFELPAAEETDFLSLDELFQDLDADSENTDFVEQGLEALLAVGTEEEASKNADTKTKKKKEKKSKKQKKEKKSFAKTVFGNVPIDPSKIKKEPTPEEKAEKKKKEAEEKKAKAEAKKLAAEEKKQLAQRNKEEKVRQKALAKEEKKAKKLEEAKQILEEMKETRINRLGATIVFLFFAVCAIVLLSGSEIFGYAISISSAENNFNKAHNNNVKYYTDAYNDIYGLNIKEEDQTLSDKIMTVMFVNKELNSYNSYMALEDYETAMHSLLLGLYRYGKYYEQAIPLGIDRDMDYVRTQILKELESTFGVSEDEAELLRSMLETAGVGGMNSAINEDAAREYNLALYEIVLESGLNNDSNN